MKKLKNIHPGFQKIILWCYVEVESKSQFKDLNNIINSLSPAQYHFGNTCPRN